MWTDQLRLARRLLPALVTSVALAAACDATHSPLVSHPALAPGTTGPAATGYRLSGVVMDAASAAPIANATVMIRHNLGVLTAETDGHGEYAFAFETTSPYRRPPGGQAVDGLGVLLAKDGTFWGSDDAGHWTAMRLLPLGATDIRHDVRLRPIVTVPAGQLISISVESDSSIVWDPEWDPWTFANYDALSEEFRVSTQVDGIVTIAVHSEPGGTPARMRCQYTGCPSYYVQSSVEIAIRADWPPLVFSIEIPRGSAPQRYLVETAFR